MIDVKIQRLSDAADLPIPHYATPGAAGMDLYAAEAKIVPAAGWALIRTGIRIQLPPGYEAQIRPRSGLALKSGITVLNTPGTIDADYRGEVAVLLMNHNGILYRVERGQRIAQMVIAPVAQAVLHEVADLDETQRSGGGFGSTGVF